MKHFFLFMVFIVTCSCQIDFTSRPQNYSIELIHFTQLQTDGHLVISPFGIWTLMTGLALGAAGHSYDQLARAFLLPKKKKTLINEYKILNNAVLDAKTIDVKIKSQNFLFVAENIQLNADFQSTINTEIGAMMQKLNFNNPDSAARIANTYIKNSGVRIFDVLTSEDFAGSRVLLTNVISFQGLWAMPFNKTETKVESFYDENKQIVGKVNMMSLTREVSLSNIRELRTFVIELPYGNDGKFSMLVFLPHANAKVADVHHGFAKMSVNNIFKILDKDTEELGLEEVDIKISRFKVSTNVVLNEPLKDMGVYDIFEPDIADFRRMTNERVHVSAIVHKADIEVTESGTTASATSTATFLERKPIIKFYANKPFMYFVIEKSTTTILFGGIYSKPTLF